MGLRHTPAGGTVIISAVSDRDHVSITVSDNGDGMTPEQLEHAFERFYRADSARTHDRTGSGIGLTISRAIINAHGGSLTAASSGPDQGSTLTIKRPTPYRRPDRRVSCLGGERSRHNVTFGHPEQGNAARYCCNSHATLQSSLHLDNAVEMQRRLHRLLRATCAQVGPFDDVLQDPSDAGLGHVIVWDQWGCLTGQGGPAWPELHRWWAPPME